MDAGLRRLVLHEQRDLGPMRGSFFDAVHHALPGTDVVRVEGVVVAVAERAAGHAVNADGVRVVLGPPDEVDRLGADDGIGRGDRSLDEVAVGLDVHVDGRDFELARRAQRQELGGLRHLVGMHDLGARHAGNAAHQVELLLERARLLVLAEAIAEQTEERGDDGVLHACDP